MHVIPGGPFDSEKKLPEPILKNLNARYHLDDPLWVQYVDYLKNLARGDLGPSFKYETRTVNDIIREGFPVSATLGAIVILIALFVGLFLGVIAALNQNKWQDYGAILLATMGVSVPSFIVAGLVMYIFAVKLRWFPPALWEGPKSMVLPVISLAGLPTAVIARLMRSSMLEVLNQDYIKTAKAKGLATKVIIYRHALRNAILPVITYLGPAIAGIFTGSFVVENIFAIPGLGKWFVQSITNRDYSVILGVTVFYSALLIFMNMLVDIAYAIVDPRIKLSDMKE
ncbi:MAG: ABC transporter permease [Thermoanaerobacteraceae bacterium]|nr:ABC transporter permease [Thermoanaerobacteraceae bacterium]